MKRNFLLFVLLVLCTSIATFAEEPPPRGQMGKVTIMTDPPGSQVFLGGEEIGKTPIVEKDFPSGRHTLVIIDQGYELVNQRFNVWPNKVNEFGGKTTIPKGHLKVSTKPAKCIIYVDGDQADMTDGAALTVRNLDAGDHMVRAECGRRSAEMLVTIKGEETSEIMLDATKK